MQQILDLARKTCQAAETYRVTRLSSHVVFEKNSLHRVTASESGGMAVRVLRNGRLGFASSNRADGLDLLVEHARSSATHGPVSQGFPNPSGYVPVENHDPGLMSMPVEDLIQCGQTIIDKLAPLQPGLRIALVFERVEETIEIANTLGLYACHLRTALKVAATAQLALDDDFLNVCDETHSSHGPVPLEEMLYRLTKKLDGAEKSVTLPTGHYPVLLAPKAVEKFISPLVTCLDARVTEDSVLHGWCGHQVVDRRISLCDDPLRPRSAASIPFDAEGFANRRLPLIHEGVLHNCLFDSTTALRLGMNAAGSAVRESVHEMPAPGAQNLFMQPLVRGRRQLFNDVSYGLIIDLFSPVRPDPLHTGSFDGDIMLGYVISRGETIGRSKHLSLRANVFEALRDRLVDISGDQIDCGKALLPYLLFDGLEIRNTT